ncbi:MAG TPA: hypothetical protein DCQ32_03315 [Cyanobacteria bacterium UBA8156]|jgi:hypothetical protein|nr:hypothetical protein [Cyanobacteria bacterium UBA8156]
MDENDLANRPEPLGESLTENLPHRILRQRAQFIAEQYGLYGPQEPDGTAARAYLSRLLNQYQGVEIALVEILVETWAQLPPPRGPAFLQRVEARLQQWCATNQGPTLSPVHFQHITGLHPLAWEAGALAPHSPGQAIANPLN